MISNSLSPYIYLPNYVMIGMCHNSKMSFFHSEAGKYPIKTLFFLLGVFLDNEDDECPQLVLINPLSDSLFYPIPFLVEWFSQAQVRVLLSALNSSHHSLHHFTIPLDNTYVSSLWGNSFLCPQF